MIHLIHKWNYTRFNHYRTGFPVFQRRCAICGKLQTKHIYRERWSDNNTLIICDSSGKEIERRY
jgi:hypothetical protein